MLRRIITLLASSLAGLSVAHAQTTLTIATVTNPDMERLQRLSSHFTRANPDIELNWVTLDENTLRQQVSTDIATKAGRFDIVSIGTFEAAIWAKRGWLSKLDPLPADYDVNDLLPTVRESLSVDGKLFAAPFYGESAFTIYRTDLFEAADLEMPEAPSWDFIREAAAKISSLNEDVHGLCLRGKAGWGENVVTVTTMANAYGARWFDERWRPQFDTPAWSNALTDYVDLLKKYGPPDATQNGYLDNLKLFQNGQCAIWVDATVAASAVTDPEQSKVADKVGFALAPDQGQGKRSNWLWAWALAVSAESPHQEAAQRFVAWATDKSYAALVAQEDGWSHAPPGTRASLYANTDYRQAAPFAAMTLASIEASDPAHPTTRPVPYQGIQYVSIPEFPGMASAIGARFAKALAGEISAAEALQNAQWLTTRVMDKSRMLNRD